jgi:AraC-like DNA-binding protein
MVVWTESYPASEELIVPRVGHGVELDARTVVDRPGGFGEHILILFTSEALLGTFAGVESVAPGTVVLHGPRSRQWYRGRGSVLTHDWLHLTGPGVPGLIASSGLPYDRPAFPADAARLSALIGDIATERHRCLPMWENAVAGLCRLLFVHLARIAHPGGTEASRCGGRHARLAGVRNRMQREPWHRWTIEELARLAHLSRTRFAVLYRECFGVAPIDELIGFRLQRAQSLLATAGLSVKEVAVCCGFEDPNYFCRVFTRRVGCAPSRYRHGL